MILGSEGNFGIITEAVLRIRKLPEVVIYDSILFRNFEQGVSFMRELGQRNIRPASARTVDNTQFQFGYSLAREKSWLKTWIDKVKKIYLLNYK